MQPGLCRGPRTAEQGDTADRLVGQFGHEDRLPVVQPAERRRLVDRLLPRRVLQLVLQCQHRLGRRTADVEQRGDIVDAGLVGPRRAAQDVDQRPAGLAVGGEVQDGRQVVGGVVHLGAEVLQRRVGVGVGVGLHAGHHRIHRMQPQRELCDDTEIAAPAAQPPQHVGVLGLTDRQHLAGRQHQFRADQVVTGHAVGARQPADAAAERETPDTGRRHHPAGAGQAVTAGDPVHVAPGGAGVDVGDPRLGVHAHPAHQRQVDDDTAVGGRVAGDAVAAAAHRDLGAGVHRVAHRGHDVVTGTALQHHPRPLVDQAVEDLPHLVVEPVARVDDIAGEARYGGGVRCHCILRVGAAELTRREARSPGWRGSTSRRG